MPGYQTPGVRLTEVTQPGTANLTSSFRLINVIGEFNSKKRKRNELIVKSNPLAIGGSFGMNSYNFSPNNTVKTVLPISNSLIVVGTALGGLQVTTDGGATWTTRNNSNTNLPSNQVNALYYDSGRLFVGTSAGLAVSSDLGASFSVYTTATVPALPTNAVNDVWATGANVYVGTTAGLAISTDNLATFQIFTQSGSNEVSTVTVVAPDATASLQNKYFTIYSATNTAWNVWYAVGNTGPYNTPGPNEIAVPITAGDSAADVAAKTAIAINAHVDFTAINSGEDVIITTVAAGNTTSILDGTNSAGYQELGLAGVTGPTVSGLVAAQTYRFRCNNVDYSFVATGVTPNFADLINDLNTALTGVATAAIVSGDIRITDTTTTGQLSYISLGLAYSGVGTQLFTVGSITGFVGVEGQHNGNSPTGFALVTTQNGALATQGYQELGLSVDSTTSAGLSATTSYRFRVNGLDYQFTTGVSAPTYAQLVTLMGAAASWGGASFNGPSLTANGFTVTVEGTSPTEDIRVTNIIYGNTSSVLLQSALNGASAQLFVSMPAFTTFDAAVLGINGVLEQSTVTCSADVKSYGGKYFLLSSTSDDYYVWFNVNNTNPDPGIVDRIGVQVNLIGNESTSTIADYISFELNYLVDFVAPNPALNVITITCALQGPVNNDITAGTSGFLVGVTTQGSLSVLLANNVKSLFLENDDLYVGTANGINVSYNNGDSWTATITTTQGLASNNITDIYKSGNTMYVSTDTGVDLSSDAGVSFTAAPSISENVNQIATSGSVIYASADTGLYVSTDSGVTFSKKTTANGLASNDTNSVALKGYVGYVGTFSGLNTTKNIDMVTEVATGGVSVVKAGSLATLSNFNLNIDFVSLPTGEIVWKNTASNLPVPGANVYVDYDYNRPASDFNKMYTYDRFDLFAQDWQMPTSDFLGNVFIYIAFEVIGIDVISFVPVRPTATDLDYIDALNMIKERSVQDIVCLNTSEAVQTQVAFSVKERSAPENAYYRTYWTGGAENFPLGDAETPNTLINRRSLIFGERVVFINAARGQVSFLTEAGTQQTMQVDGAFMAGLIVTYYNITGSPNVEVMQKIMPGFTLYASDFDDYYSKSRLVAGGAAGLYTLEAVGSTGLPRVVDPLTTDITTIEKSDPNIIRAKDYINTDLAIQIRANFQGRLLTDPNQHATSLVQYMNVLFGQYKSTRVIVSFKGLSAVRDPSNPQKFLIKYAFQVVYTHKYTDGEFYLDIPTG